MCATKLHTLNNKCCHCTKLFHLAPFCCTKQLDGRHTSPEMDSGNPGTSRKSTRPTWLKPGEVWGGDNNDDPQIGSTLGLRVKRWYRSLPGLNERQEARAHIVGSKVTLRKMLFVLIATVTLYLFLQQVLPHAAMRIKASRNCESHAINQSY